MGNYGELGGTWWSSKFILCNVIKLQQMMPETGPVFTGSCDLIFLVICIFYNLCQEKDKNGLELVHYRAHTLRNMLKGKME